jgi:hypothetical protein
MSPRYQRATNIPATLILPIQAAQMEVPLNPPSSPRILVRLADHVGIREWYDPKRQHRLTFSLVQGP